MGSGREGQSYWIEDGGMPPVFKHHMVATQSKGKGHPYGDLIGWLQKEVQAENPLEKVMPWFAQGVDAGDAEFGLRRPWFFFGRQDHGFGERLSQCLHF